jgi:hypothetical protein
MWTFIGCSPSRYTYYFNILTDSFKTKNGGQIDYKEHKLNFAFLLFNIVTYSVAKIQVNIALIQQEAIHDFLEP